MGSCDRSSGCTGVHGRWSCRVRGSSLEAMARRTRRYWLMKSEPDVFSIDDLARRGRAEWEGVRSYQARNLMRDEMAVGDMVLFYHSSTTPPGVAGVARVASEARPDHHAF